MVGGTVAGRWQRDRRQRHRGRHRQQPDRHRHSQRLILGNSIYGNTKSGHRPGRRRGHPRTTRRATPAPNLFQDFPLITEAYTVGSTTTITGTVSGPANSTLRVELFSNSTADPSGYGQGKVFLGYATSWSPPACRGGGGSFTFSPSSSSRRRPALSPRRRPTSTAIRPSSPRTRQVSAAEPLDIGYAIIRAGVQSDQEGLHRDRQADQRRNDRGSTAFEFLLDNLDSRRDADQRQRLHGQRHPLYHGQHQPRSPTSRPR